MEKKQVLIITGENQYGVLKKFAEELKAGFEKSGCTVEWLDIVPLLLVDIVFAETKNKEYDFVVLFNNMGLGVNDLFVKSSKTIIWSIFVDAPMYQLERLQSCSENLVVSFIDRNHVSYAKREFRHLPYITFMPHGGSRVENIISFSERKYPLVFFGSYVDTQELENKLSEEKEPWNYVLANVINRVYDGEADFYDVIEEEMDFAGKNCSEYMRKLVLVRFRYVYGLLRNIKRIHLLEVLGASGIPVEVYGNGWEDYENRYPQYIHIHKAVDYDETLEIMADAKIVLNNMPLYTNGSHERVFTAMRSGAVAFSEENSYFREEFRENREIVFFNYKNLEQIPEKIKFLLEHEGLAERIAEAGRVKVEKCHTWEMRAKAMLDMLLQVKGEQEQHQKKYHVPVRSERDEAFNRMLSKIQRADEAMLYETMKEHFVGNALFDSVNEALLEKSLESYPYWGRLKVREGIFEICSQRAHQMKSRIEEFVWLYRRLEDETSKKVLLVLLQHWLNNESLDKMPESRWRQYFDMDIIQFDAEEVFVDCGAYNGDTLVNFILECKKYKKVYCYEFDDVNLEELQKNAQKFSNIEVRPQAVGDKNGEITVIGAADRSSSRLDSNGNGEKVPMVTLDRDIQEKITFIKADIEGAEKLMLQGAKRHIQEEKPKLAIAVYHGNSDILDIPLLIRKLNADYKFYLRYYGGSLYPNEIVFYAV